MRLDQAPAAGEPLRAITAVVTDTAVIAPDWRNMPRSPAMAATWSGASCRLALFAAGTDSPMPSPVSAAPIASQAYGETGALDGHGQQAAREDDEPGDHRPAGPRCAAAPARPRPATPIMPTARAVSSVPAPSEEMPYRSCRVQRHQRGEAERRRAVQVVDQVHHAEAAPAQQPVRHERRRVAPRVPHEQAAEHHRDRPRSSRNTGLYSGTAPLPR